MNKNGIRKKYLIQGRDFFSWGLLIGGVCFLAACGDDPPIDDPAAAITVQTGELTEKSLPMQPETNTDQPEAAEAELADAEKPQETSKERFRDYMATRGTKGNERLPKPKPTAPEMKRLMERDSGHPMVKGLRSALLQKFDHDRDGIFSAAETEEAQEYLNQRKLQQLERELPQRPIGND
ncbi:MAG: hypothetical protein ACI9R3_004199 [Verrucomicrobiales bacterium]|jgi:hypothetical protein